MDEDVVANQSISLIQNAVFKHPEAFPILLFFLEFALMYCIIMEINHNKEQWKYLCVGSAQINFFCYTFYILFYVCNEYFEY